MVAQLCDGDCDADATVAIVRSGIQAFPYPTLLGHPRDDALHTRIVRLIERGLAR